MYDVDVIIGDGAIQKPVQWRIGKVNITPPAPLPVADEVLPALSSGAYLLTMVPYSSLEHRVAE